MLFLLSVNHGQPGQRAESALYDRLAGAEAMYPNETFDAPSARAMEELFAAKGAEEARAPHRQRSFDLAAASRSSCRASPRARSPGRQLPPRLQFWCRRP